MRTARRPIVAAFLVFLILAHRGDRPAPLAASPQAVLPSSIADAVDPPMPRLLGPAPEALLTLQEQGTTARLAHVAALEAQVFAVHDPRAIDLWELGLAHLVGNDPARAIDILQIVSRREPLNAGIATDLGAAYYLRAVRDGVAEDLVKSVDASARATRLSPQIWQAHHNLAIALEGIGWESEASIARQQVVHAPSAPLAHTLRAMADARTQRSWNTLRQLAYDNPEAARIYVETAVLTGVAEALPEDTANCGTWSEAARTIGESVAESTGDRLLQDLAKDLHDGCSMDAVGRRRFAAAVSAVTRAQELTEAGEMQNALALLSTAQAAIADTRAIAPLADLWRILADFSVQHPSRMLVRIRDARAAATRDAHLYPSGRLQLVEGSVALRLAKRTEALEHYEAAVSTFKRLREFEYTASTMALVAQSLKEQGHYLQAWSWMVDSLRLTDRIASPRRKFFVLFNAATTALEAGLFDAAAVFTRPLLGVAAEWDDATGWSSALTLDAEVAQRLGRGPAARDALRAAQVRAREFTDSSYRRQFEAQIAYTNGIISVQEAPAAAVAELTTALTYFHDRGLQHRLAGAYLWRGRALANSGRFDAAEDDWRSGIAILEDQRPQIRDEQLRISHLSSLWDLYGEMISSLALRRGRPEEAFAFVERSRARALLDSMPQHERFVPQAPAAIVKQLPSDVVVVQYSALADVLLIEVLTQSTRRHAQVPIARQELEALVFGFRHQIALGLPDAATAARLHALLFGPVADLLPGRRVIVVPDGWLGAVPFAALRDPASGRRAVQDFAVAVAPSVTLLGIASNLVQHRPEGRETAVVVGDPSGADAARYGLRQLPGAAHEAAEVAKLYPASVSSAGARATRREFLSMLQDATVVHFAGHAVADPRFPSRSYLLLGADEGHLGEGRVFPSDIAALRLTQTRLAVLSACSTAAGTPDRGEGVLNLARPFLIAGVPQVVGTLWDVDDAATRRLLVSFHERVQRGEDVIEALRQAQLERLAAPGGEDTSAWAAFVAIGGVHEKH